MDFVIKFPLVEEIVQREMHIFSVQLGYRHELSLHQRGGLVQREAFNRRRNFWAKSIPVLKEKLESLRIDNILLGIAAAG